MRRWVRRRRVVGGRDRSATEREITAVTLGLTSCDFVGDAGCTDTDCERCHAGRSYGQTPEAWAATWAAP